jgi:hypothetical protein
MTVEVRKMALKFHPAEKRVLKANGFSRAVISLWETGKGCPSKHNAEKVAALLGRDLLDLLYGRNPKEEEGK